MNTLLIIDDNYDIRQQLKWSFAGEYAVLLAGDVNEGVNAFRDSRPNVVLLDLGLPPHEDTSVEGFRGLEELRAIDPQAKVIILTGNNEQENVIRAEQLGAYGFFAKPPVLSELRDVIQRACH